MLQLCSVRDLKDHIYDATDELSIARRKLQDLRDEMQKVKDEVYKSQNNLKRATHELTKAVSDLQAPQLYSLNEEEAAILRYHLSLANSDIEDARKNMLEATNDLTTEVQSLPFYSYSISSSSRCCVLLSCNLTLRRFLTNPPRYEPNRSNMKPKSLVLMATTT